MKIDLENNNHSQTNSKKIITHKTICTKTKISKVTFQLT